MSNILPPTSLLHRAFSVFLFRPSDGRLLLQKRASEKITFPDMWTNTCCSHPLSVKQEMIPEGQLGVRRAAQRKLFHELGIPNAQVPLDGFVYLTRIHYLAPSSGIWGEHESKSWICIADMARGLTNMTSRSSRLHPLHNGRRDARRQPERDLRHVLGLETRARGNVRRRGCVHLPHHSLTAYLQLSWLTLLRCLTGNSFTPWFRLIAESFLYKWWDELLKLSTSEDNPSTTAGVKADASVLRELVTEQDKNVIHRMVKDTVNASVDGDGKVKDTLE